MSIRLVWPFLDLAKSNGRTWVFGKVREHFGLTDAQLEDPDTRVPLQLTADLLGIAVSESRNRDLGLLAACRVDDWNIGISEFVARAQPTVREALEQCGRYARLLGDGAEHTLQIDGTRGVLQLRLDPELEVHEACAEFLVALGILRLRRITGMSQLAPLEIHFTHPEPADTSNHQRIFGCPVRFGMPVIQIVLSADLLSMPMVRAEPALGKVLARHADALLERIPKPNDMSERVRTLLRDEDQLRIASAEGIARRLGMSVRTLARRLEDEGQRFSELIDELRKQGVLRDLAQTDLTISEIAQRQGYASSQSLHRALQRWTGTSASRWRLQARIKRSAHASDR